MDVNDLTETFEYDLDGQTYQFTFSYNDEGDFFKVSLDDPDGNRLVTEEKLILNQPLFKNLFIEGLPITPLTPMDESGRATRCGIDEFMETVFLYEDTLSDEYINGSLPVDGDVEGDLDD